MSVPVIITEWALQSYLDLVHRNVVSRQVYWKTIRPDVELLRDGIPPAHSKFATPGFWGPATDKAGATIQHGFKMKWHNIGPGRIQLRLAVVGYGANVYLCQGYVKESESKDKREMAKLKTHINDIVAGSFQTRGTL